MKYYMLLLIVTIVVGFISCKKESGSLNENYIPINKCQAYNIDGKTLTCCLDSIIQDSRCPINTFCIWAGIGVARFTINTENSAHTITLCTQKFAPYNKDTTIAGFKIEMISLLPASDLNKVFNYNDYTAEVKITKP
jgi:hypothetical protein